ncbi:MAG: class I SAM-dependent methyltransferase [Cyanobacteria bacterium REEB65]|nr:class I SAM-dependent methyltransferase [Cyanobacteria bacterium REEB65]
MTWDAQADHAARTQAIAKAILRKIPLSSTMKALEVGAGTGQLGLALQDRLGSILFTDASSGMIDVLKGKLQAGGWKHLEARVLDITTETPPAGPFDLVFSQMALHHIPDVADHLAILYRSMASGATLCVADLDKEDGSFHGDGFHGHKGFNRDDLRSQAAAAGFADIAIETVYQMPREVDGEHRVFPIFLLTALKA